MRSSVGKYLKKSSVDGNLGRTSAQNSQISHLRRPSTTGREEEDEEEEDEEEENEIR